MGEFTKDVKVSARITSKTKRQIDQLKKYNLSEIITIGAEYLSTEQNKLSFEKGELELEIANLKAELHRKEAHLSAINNRLRIIAPRELDEETLKKMLIESALDTAQRIFKLHGEESLDKMRTGRSRNSLKSTAEDLGFDEDAFLDEVEKQLVILCKT